MARRGARPSPLEYLLLAAALVVVLAVTAFAVGRVLDRSFGAGCTASTQLRGGPPGC